MDYTIDEIYREWVRYGVIGSKENFQARHYYISVVRINLLGQCKDFVLIEEKAVEMYDIESEVKIMKNFYLNKNYRICNNLAESDCIYAICNDVDLLLKDFNDYGIEECGIDRGDTELVIYRWDENDSEWTKLNPSKTEDILSVFYSQYPEHCPVNVGGITRNTERKWNWKIKLSNDIIQMNDEPVSLDEITSNFEIIQKPSFFGKRIDKIIIERV